MYSAHLFYISNEIVTDFPGQIVYTRFGSTHNWLNQFVLYVSKAYYVTTPINKDFHFASIQIDIVGVNAVETSLILIIAHFHQFVS